MALLRCGIRDLPVGEVTETNSPWHSTCGFGIVVAVPVSAHTVTH